jgi:hypothetical protein
MKTHDTTGWKQAQGGAVLGSVLLALALQAGGASLKPAEPVLLEGTQGRFDFIRMDAARHRLLLAHTGNRTLDVFDVESRKLLKAVPTGAAQDAAVDVKRNRYYASVSAPPRLAIVDAGKLEMIGEVSLPAAADLMTFNPSNGLAYCASSRAKISVVRLEGDTLSVVETVNSSAPGQKSIAIDPSTHIVWTAYATGAQSFAQPFIPEK